MAGLGMLIGMIVFVAIVLAFAIPILLIWGGVSVLRALAGPRRPSGPFGDPAVEQLRSRLARGEISQAQYEQSMWDLGYEKVR
jgi:uncharacterized membrane protein